MTDKEKIQMQIDFYENIKKQCKLNPEKANKIIEENMPRNTIYKYMRECTKYKEMILHKLFV